MVPIVIFLVGAALMSFYFVNELRMTQQRLHDDAEDHLRVLATLTAGDLEAAFRLGERAKARAAIERLAGNSRVETGLLADRAGNIVFSSNVRLVGRRVSEVDNRLEAIFREATGEQAVVTRHWHSPDGVAGAFPINMRNDPESFLPQQIGWLVIDTDLSPLAARYHQELSQRLIVYALALGVVSILFWLYFRTALLKRIGRLTLATRKFAKGDFGHRPDIGSGDELSELAAEFRAMADHLQRHTEEMDYLSSHDAMTGLLNRHGFEQHLEGLLAHLRHSSGLYLLCYLDIDGFRVINDTQGHAAGDSLLREVAAQLRDGFSSDIPVARLAGDEFAILIPTTADTDPHHAAEEIQGMTSDFRFQWKREKFRVAFNIGVVQVDRHVPSAEKALSLADAACYAAKETTHTRIRVWNQSEETLAEHHGEMHWVSRIQSALDQDRFELFAQPIFPARGEAGLHLELLVRMRDSHGSLVRPDRFLPAAEHYGLISQIDRWVLRTALQVFRDNPHFRQRLDLCAINLSALSLGDAELIETVRREVTRPGGLSGDQLCFEITETAAVTNMNVASGFMAKLRHFGCRFALDDFGSGVSSFGYLKNLDVEFLKIDGLFVRGVLTDSSDRAIVRSINDIGHEMGKLTVAEFVESRELAEEIRRIGVDYLQGNGLAPAKPLRTVLERAVSRIAKEQR
jgi:diguanylate cyclase (GGDEF)-like protein